MRKFSKFKYCFATFQKYALICCLALALHCETDAAESEEIKDKPAVTLKTLNGHFPFETPTTFQAWQQRSEQLRLRVAIANGLHPMLPRPPVDATTHSLIQRDGFTVEKVYFESLPNHFVTGLLFRPQNNLANVAEAITKKPAVLCPHGHGGRLQTYDEETLAELIQSGDERFADSGSMPKIARCAQLARMGCVVFIFDMLGYADSMQIGHELAHKKRSGRAGESVPGHLEPWMFFSTPADARLQSIMGLQTFNALRSLDFLAALPDVDATRIGVTGGSGGGTQTIMLDALDDRIAASFPNGMVSTGMQGGCVCENCCYLRIGTGNVELAALMAPKPMAMTAADDWTANMMQDGFPELKKIYRWFDAAENVQCSPMLQFKHNYNYVSREKMYTWFNKHLQLGLSEPIVEGDFHSLSPSELSVWDERHPAPMSKGSTHESAVCKWWNDAATRSLASALGKDAKLDEFQAKIQPALNILYDVELPSLSELKLEWQAGPELAKNLVLQQSVVNYRGEVVELNLIKAADQSVVEASKTIKAITVLVVDYDVPESSKVELPEEITSALEQNGLLLTVKMLGNAGQKQDMVATNGLRSAAFTYGYNRPLAVRNCQTILFAIAAANSISRGDINLVSNGDAVAAALPAVAIAGEAVQHAQIAVNRFRFSNLRFQDDAAFVPGMVKYGDVDAWAAARAPYGLQILGDSDTAFPTALAIYAAKKTSDQLIFH